MTEQLPLYALIPLDLGEWWVTCALFAVAKSTRLWYNNQKLVSTVFAFAQWHDQILPTSFVKSHKLPSVVKSGRWKRRWPQMLTHRITHRTRPHQVGSASKVCEQYMSYGTSICNRRLWCLSRSLKMLIEKSRDYACYFISSKMQPLQKSETAGEKKTTRKRNNLCCRINALVN